MDQWINLLLTWGWLGLVVATFTESFISPLMPDLILVPLCLSDPTNAVKYAALATVTECSRGICRLWRWPVAGPECAGPIFGGPGDYGKGCRLLHGSGSLDHFSGRHVAVALQGSKHYRRRPGDKFPLIYPYFLCRTGQTVYDRRGAHLLLRHGSHAAISGLFPGQYRRASRHCLSLGRGLVVAAGA